MSRHSRSARAGWMAAVLAWSAIGASPVAAHAVLTSISPEDGAALVEPPTSIDLTFSEPLITAAATVVVTDDGGVVVTDDPGPAGWIGGYSIVQGEDLASVQAVLAGHPHNQMGTIEILQMRPMPGA